MAIEIKRMGHTAIAVDDIDKSVEFYVNNFGFEKVFAAEDWGMVKKGNDDLAFVKKGVSSHPPHFGLRVNSKEDIDKSYNDIKDKVKILREPKMHRDDSYSFYFADSDNNVVEIIYDPRYE